MSMKIGNYAGVSSYQNNASKTGGYKNVREYSNYLMNKFSCLTPGKNTSVSVTSGLLRRAMKYEKMGQWLERELSKAADYIKDAQQSAKARGSKLIYCAIEFAEEYTTMYTCTVTDTEGTDSFIDKWLERVKEATEEQKSTGKVDDKTDIEQALKQHNLTGDFLALKGEDLKSLTDSFIEKMSSVNSAKNSSSGIDMKI